MPSLRNLAALFMTFAALSLAAPAAAQFSDRYNFFKAVKDGDVLKVKSFIDQPGSTLLDMRDNDSGEMALHMVTRRRDVPWMNFLIANGASVNVRDKNGNAPVHIAAQLGYIDGIQVLVQRKADVNALNSRGESPLVVAVQQRNAMVVRELLSAGANPDLADHVAGMSARDYAERDRRAAAITRMFKDNDNKAKAGEAKPATVLSLPNPGN
ncbi:ankyrin repeat domain-containing protein [Sphingosinicella soli]|uniref:Ankyrin repeat protein n=1 Tax=Sphingosinicella soli TaxID=333708 RepID=A0A7W7B353_9SPHN|nr:ankyrin repeat domain-containing protein [Sphingosinicella soli]MBB4633091.1 ankyrin repeat protein [Sphingosinicella soli]